MRMFENRVLRKVFGLKREAVTGYERRLYNEKLHDLCFSPDVTGVIKSIRVRWLEHVSCMGESKGSYSGLVGKPEGRRPLGSCWHRWEDSIQVDPQEMEWCIDWIDLSQDGYRWHAFVNVVMNLRVP